MKCFIGIEKKLEDNTMFYREPVKIDKDWSVCVPLIVGSAYVQPRSVEK